MGAAFNGAKLKGLLPQELPRDRHLVNTLVGHGDEVDSVAFSHDGSYID